MGRLVVAVDRAVGVSPADVAAAWNGDDEAREAGEFLGDVPALVVIPLAVNLASWAPCALVSGVMARLRPARPDAGDLEVVAAAGDRGELVVVVRVAGPRR